MNSSQKILVIKLGALGDFVQALGPMAAIARHHPDADITLLTTENFVSLGISCGYFDHVWNDEKPKRLNLKGWASLRKRLNQGKFDRVYDLQNNKRTALYFRLFKKKPEWVGAAKGASHRNDSPQRTAGHSFDGHIQTLKLADINDVTIDKMDWVKGDINHFDIQKPYILLVPGCAPERPEKRWAAKNFGALARTLHGWGYTPVILGTKSEEDIAETICKIFPESINLTGKTALSDIILLARHAATAIGNDTGPMHLIAQTSCPSYVLFSRHSDPVKHAPKGESVLTIRMDEINDISLDKVISTLSVHDFRAA